MSPLAHDVRQALRAFRGRPGYAVVAAGTIALAIAANTVMFSIVYGVLLRPLPFPEPGRLVTIDALASTGFHISNSIPNYRDWRDRSRVFSSVSGADQFVFTLTGGGPAEIVTATAVVGDFFRMFGFEPALGRLPGSAETESGPGMPAVAVLSHAFWQQHFGGDRGVVGRVLTLDGRPYAVAGVLPSGAGFPDLSAELYLPMGAIPDLPWNNRDAGFGMRTYARLKPGVPLATARSDLARVGRDLRAELGPGVAVPEVRSLESHLVGDVRAQLWLLMAAVGFVLLIAVTNVSNLFLVRGEERHREIAIRKAVGAGGGSIVRLMLSEALLVSLLGAAAGVTLAYGLVGVLVPMLPADLPSLLVARLRVDGAVLAVAVTTAISAGLLFGAVPAWRATHLDVAETMKAGARTVAAGRGRLRSALVVAEVALAVTVLIGSGLTLRSLDRLSHVDAGFDPAHVLMASVQANAQQVSTQARWLSFYDRLRERAAALPGVRSAAVTLLVPLSQRSWEKRAYPEGTPVTDANAQSVLYNVVSPQYFEAMGIPIVRGRDFAPGDRDGTAPVAIVDQTMARRFWPGQNPVGRRLTIRERGADSALVYRTVVGVVPNVRHYELDSASRIEIYIPLAQTAGRAGMTMTLALRTAGVPDAVGPALRSSVTALDAEAAVFQMRPLSAYVDDALARSRAVTRVLAAFAAAALALVASGIFAVMSYDVARRRREIAVRMAVGATSRDVFAWVGTRALRVTGVGLATGMAAAAGASRLMTGLLFQVQPLDPVSYGAAAAGLALVAWLATYLPARRATRVDPVVALNDA